MTIVHPCPISAPPVKGVTLLARFASKASSCASRRSVALGDRSSGSVICRSLERPRRYAAARLGRRGSIQPWSQGQEELNGGQRRNRLQPFPVSKSGGSRLVGVRNGCSGLPGLCLPSPPPWGRGTTRSVVE